MCVSLNAYLETYRQYIKTPDHNNHNPFYLHKHDGAKLFTFAVQDEVLRLGIAGKHSTKIGLIRYLLILFTTLHVLSPPAKNIQ